MIHRPGEELSRYSVHLGSYSWLHDLGVYCFLSRATEHFKNLPNWLIPSSLLENPHLQAKSDGSILAWSDLSWETSAKKHSKKTSILYTLGKLKWLATYSLSFSGCISVYIILLSSHWFKKLFSWDKNWFFGEYSLSTHFATLFLAPLITTLSVPFISLLTGFLYAHLWGILSHTVL